MKKKKMKNTERFSNRAKNYVLYRPHYPKEIVPFLKESIGLSNKTVVADIGSGTGISSELFLQNGNQVYAVEPNKEMRESAEVLYKGEKNFISVNATAENTSLDSKSIDLIVAGQAFHWFDKVQSKEEFKRIIAFGGHLLLMWNDRADSPFQRAYDDMLKGRETVRNAKESIIKSFFSPCDYSIMTFPNYQSLDLESLKGRFLSSSYAPEEHEEDYNPMLKRLEKIFQEFSENGQVRVLYQCNLYYGKFN